MTHSIIEHFTTMASSQIDPCLFCAMEVLPLEQSKSRHKQSNCVLVHRDDEIQKDQLSLIGNPAFSAYAAIQFSDFFFLSLLLVERTCQLMKRN